MNKNPLRVIRESLLISKTELAKKANISPITVTRIEQGYPCRKKTKRKITLALKHKFSCGNEVVILSDDNKDKRSGLDRRQYSYDEHIPERRSDQSRRKSLARRLKSRKSE